MLVAVRLDEQLRACGHDNEPRSAQRTSQNTDSSMTQMDVADPSTRQGTRGSLDALSSRREAVLADQVELVRLPIDSLPREKDETLTLVLLHPVPKA